MKLEASEHRMLVLRAADLAELVLPYFENQRPHDQRPRHAIAAARAWARGEIAVGQARAAAFAAHAAARETTNPPPAPRRGQPVMPPLPLTSPATPRTSPTMRQTPSLRPEFRPQTTWRWWLAPT